MVLSVNCSCYPKNYFLGFYLNFAVFIVQFSRYKEHKMFYILCSPNWTSFSLLFVRFLFFLLTESIKETFGQLALLVGSSGLEPPTLRLSGVRSNHLSYEPLFKVVRVAWFNSSTPGGDEEDRTPDPLRARQVLSQLSYTPESCGVSERRSSLFFLRILLGPSKSNNMQAFNQALTG